MKLFTMQITIENTHHSVLTIDIFLWCMKVNIDAVPVQVPTALWRPRGKGERESVTTWVEQVGGD